MIGQVILVHVSICVGLQGQSKGFFSDQWVEDYVYAYTVKSSVLNYHFILKVLNSFSL